eukprot:m.257196 g.257196  ORF g.257196 m.257196 type:complete len:414 (-) comp17581_c0_seq3:957-2198(-)
MTAMAFGEVTLQFLMLIAIVVANDVCLETTCASQAAACSSVSCSSAKNNFILLTQGDPACNQACFDASVPSAAQFSDRLKLNQFTSCYSTCYGLLDVPDTTTTVATTTTLPSPCASRSPNLCAAPEERCQAEGCSKVWSCLESCSNSDNQSQVDCQATCLSDGKTDILDVQQAVGTRLCQARLCIQDDLRAIHLTASRDNSWIYLDAYPFASHGEPGTLAAALNTSADTVQLWAQVHNGLLRYQSMNGMALVPFDLTALSIRHVYFDVGAAPSTFPPSPQFNIAATYDASKRQVHVQGPTATLILSQLLAALEPATSTASTAALPSTQAAATTPATGLAVGSDSSSRVPLTTILVISVGSFAVLVLVAVIVFRLRKMRVESYDVFAVGQNVIGHRSMRKRRSVHLEKVESSSA